jgi:hypothetical protein
VTVRYFYGPMHRGFRRDGKLECLVSDRGSGQHRRCNADECVYKDSSIVVVIIQHRHAGGVM